VVYIVVVQEIVKEYEKCGMPREPDVNKDNNVMFLLHSPLLHRCEAYNDSVPTIA
jgi:hypothetical protein